MTHSYGYECNDGYTSANKDVVDRIAGSVGTRTHHHHHQLSRIELTVRTLSSIAVSIKAKRLTVKVMDDRLSLIIDFIIVT